MYIYRACNWRLNILWGFSSGKSRKRVALIQILICTESTRWAPTSCKWSYNHYKWSYKWVTGVISRISFLWTKSSAQETTKTPMSWYLLTILDQLRDFVHQHEVSPAFFWGGEQWKFWDGKPLKIKFLKFSRFLHLQNAQLWGPCLDLQPTPVRSEKKGGDVMSHDVMALPMFSKVFPPRPEVQIRRVFPKKTSSRRFAGWVDGDGISWIFFWGKWNGKMMVC